MRKPYFVPEGNLRELTQSAGGWMLLSQLPLRKLDYTIRRVNLAAQPESPVNVQEFIQRIAAVKRGGYADGEHISFRDAATLSVALPITLNGQPAALGVSGHLNAIQARRKELTELLLHGASLLRNEQAIGDLTSFGKEPLSSAPAPKRDFVPAIPRRWCDALGQFDESSARASQHMPARG